MDITNVNEILIQSGYFQPVENTAILAEALTKVIGSNIELEEVFHKSGFDDTTAINLLIPKLTASFLISRDSLTIIEIARHLDYFSLKRFAQASKHFGYCVNILTETRIKASRQQFGDTVNQLNDKDLIEAIFAFNDYNRWDIDTIEAELKPSVENENGTTSYIVEFFSIDRTTLVIGEMYDEDDRVVLGWERNSFFHRRGKPAKVSYVMGGRFEEWLTGGRPYKEDDYPYVFIREGQPVRKMKYDIKTDCFIDQHGHCRANPTDELYWNIL